MEDKKSDSDSEELEEMKSNPVQAKVKKQITIYLLQKELEVKARNKMKLVVKDLVPEKMANLIMKKLCAYDHFPNNATLHDDMIKR